MDYCPIYGRMPLDMQKMAFGVRGLLSHGTLGLRWSDRCKDA